MIKNIGSNWLLILFQVGITFVLTPFTIHALGQAQYGAWVLIASVTSYLSMLALGIPMATVRFVAKYAGAGQQEEMNRTIGSCAALYLMIGAASAVVGTVLFFAFDQVYTIPPALRHDAHWAFALVVLNVSASFIEELPYGIMAAHHNFVTRNKVQMASLAVRLGLTYLLLTLRATMVFLAVIQMVCFALEFTVASWLVRKHYPAIRARLGDFDWAIVREVFSFSAFVLILNIGGQLIFQSDSIVIGAFLPLSEIPHFSVACSLAVYLMEFVIGIGAVVMPMAATLQAQGKLPELRQVFLRWSKITVGLTLFAFVYLMVLGPRFLGWWIGWDFEAPAGRVLQILMLGNLAFLPVRGVCLPVLMGLGKPRAATLAFLAVGVLNVVMSVALVKPLGLAGVAIGTAVPNILFAAVALGLACHELDVRLFDYLRYVVPRMVLAAVPVLLLLVWIKQQFGVRSFAGLFTAGVAALALSAVLAVVFVYRNDPSVDVQGWLARRLAVLRR